MSRDEESDVSVCYASPAEGTVLVLYSPRLLGWTDSGLLHGTRDGASYWAVDQNLEVVEQAFDVTELQCGHDAWRGRSVVSLLPIAQTDSVAIDPMETTL